MTQQTPEEYVGPDRGETVETTNQDYDYPTTSDKPGDLYKPEWGDDNPIPVYVVERPRQPQITEWSSERFIVADSAVQIAGSRRNRVRMVVKNEGTDSVYIDPTQGVNAAFSFRLAQNEEVELTNNGQVWARCEATDTATISVVQEYDVPLDDRHV